MTQKFSNNARSLLQASINSSVTSLTVASADADLFPVANTGSSAVNTAGLDWFKATLEDSSGNIEVIYVRTRASGAAVFSNIQRGQDGTTARSFTAGAAVELRLTADDIATRPASAISVTDAGGYFAASEVEAALQEVGSQLTPINKIINGAMSAVFRTGSATVNSGSLFYAADRWACAGVSADGVYTAAVSTSSPPAGFSEYLRLTVTNADSSIGSGQQYYCTQKIEGRNIKDLSFGTSDAKAITVAFRVRSSLTGTFGASLKNYGASRTYPFNYTINAANTWETKIINIAGDTTGTWLTTSATGMELVFDLGSGSTLRGTAAAWSSSDYTAPTGSVSLIATNGATLDLTGVMLVRGTYTNPQWVQPDITTLMRQCGWYYEKSYAQGTSPGTGGSPVGSVILSFNAASYVYANVPILPKRTTGTLTFYDLAGNASKVTSGGVDNVSIGVGGINLVSNCAASMISLDLSIVSQANAKLQFHYVVDAELT